MTTTFKSSSELQKLRAATAKSVTFATSSQTNPVESLPTEERWWALKFLLGKSRVVRSLLRKQYKGSTTSSTSPTMASFVTPSAESAIVSDVAFAPVESGLGPPYPLAVACGPRVSLYGGTPSSSLSRALARTKDRQNEEDEDEDDADGLFGERTAKQDGDGVKPDRVVGTGGHPAYCAAYRSDARLLAIGCHGGYVKVCDTASRATLRTFSTKPSSHHPVRTVGWLSQLDHDTDTNVKDANRTGKKLWSAGDDATLRVWDLAAGGGDSADPLLILTGHGDSIRASVSLAHKTRTLLITGSYDHTIRIWDMHGLSKLDSSHSNSNASNDRCLSIMDHGAPVECLLVIDPPSTTSSTHKTTPIVASAGGTIIKLWNPITGDCLATIPTKHSKTITSLCLTTIIRNQYDNISNVNHKTFHRRILTAGLDGLIRIHSADDLFPTNADPQQQQQQLQLPYLHGVKTPHPITALAISPDSTRLVIGTSTGLLTVRQRAKYTPQGQKLKRSRAEQAKHGTQAYFSRGASQQADADDHVVLLLHKKRLHKYDVLLKQFRYADALDEALQSRDARGVAAVLEELGRRRGLSIALSNRDEETLQPLLAFVVNFISDPRYAPLLVGVANQLCDIYGDVFGQSDAIDEQFGKLRRKVREEVATQKVLARLLGQIDAVMYAAESSAS